MIGNKKTLHKSSLTPFLSLPNKTETGSLNEVRRAT